MQREEEMGGRVRKILKKRDKGKNKETDEETN